jgi:hypothetical protein
MEPVKLKCFMRYEFLTPYDIKISVVRVATPCSWKESTNVWEESSGWWLSEGVPSNRWNASNRLHVITTQKFVNLKEWLKLVTYDSSWSTLLYPNCFRPIFPRELEERKKSGEFWGNFFQVLRTRGVAIK